MSEEDKQGFRLFRKSKPDADGPVRKTKSFKRIRGLLNGESRRDRLVRKAKERSAKSGQPAEADDQSTLYHVDVDERSVLSSPSQAAGAPGSLLGPDTGDAEPGKKTYMLKVVLLLMDPDSRRFELLQLEFDSLKALVSDVLAQIPISVTEEALRKQTYTGICGRDGKEMTPDKLLANFCKGNDVLVAVPSTVPAKECARLAKPILNDDKVVSMVRNLSWLSGL